MPKNKTPKPRVKPMTLSNLSDVVSKKIKDEKIRLLNSDPQKRNVTNTEAVESLILQVKI